MIHDASTLPLPLHLRTEVCVIGSGAGGGTAAMVAAEAGRKVVVLEAGEFVPPAHMTQREEQMLPKLLYANGSQTSRDRGVRVHQGRAVGGSTVHNIDLCKRIPAPVLAAWRRDRGLEHLSDATLEALYTEAEALLRVGPVPEAMVSRHNRLLEQGAQALGWRSGPLRHNRTGCAQSGFCLLGCAYDAKNNVPKVVLPRAIAAGVEVLSRCRAVRVTHARGAVTGVQAVALDPWNRTPIGEVTIQAERVVIAGSATGTPALLMRSDVPDPSRSTGRHLHIHPALVAAGDFDDPVHAAEGIPQSIECTQWLDFEAAHAGKTAPLGTRTWIIPAFAQPMGTATQLPGFGAAHRAIMDRYDHMAVFTGMVHDGTDGVVRPRGDLGWSIDYWPNEADRQELLFGLAACTRLLLAAGARRVIVPTDPPTILHPGDDPNVLKRLVLRPGFLDITGVHPMGSVPMGDDPARAAVDSRGRHHHLRGLWIADGSLFPTSIGVPPQVSIYAMGLHVGRDVASA